jgi:TPP-dependent pyruvate/acetoin dehydrogenase alpha subunit
MAAILAGRSITLCWPEHRFVTSAIVGGILPIAAGIALGEKRAGAGRHVHCFVGDMTALGGAYHEVQRYARGHQLPLSLVVEDNGKSVGTPTLEAWGVDEPGRWPYVERHMYDNPWPHAGAGQWVKF